MIQCDDPDHDGTRQRPSADLVDAGNSTEFKEGRFVRK
jgi:hypothetical protein